MGLASRVLERSLHGAAAAAVLLAGCSSGPEDRGGVVTDPAAAVAASGPTNTADVVAALEGRAGARPDTATDVAADGESNDSGELGPIDPLDIPGEIISEYSLVEGDCFNRIEGLQAGRRLAITARTGCDEPHWAEVYHTFDLDAPHPAIYPGDDAVRGFALRVCYEQFEGFVGELYELSVYEIAVFTPNRTNFEHEVARYRGVHCWLHDPDDESVSGSARGAAR
ncbi:MAG: hypothetical protein OXL98_01315 [Acidimicrobiaceae bacterium]|nr:hypothetical protein [Acidimicrobiaceae bacterium]